MPIVISEFEIVPEQLPPPAQASGEAEPAPQRLPTPRELALAMRHQAHREARVRAD